MSIEDDINNLKARTDSLVRIHRKVRHLIWMTGFNIALLLVVFWQACTIASRLP
jgi:hypothetical protein